MPKRGPGRTRRISEGKRAEARRLYARGRSTKEISREIGVSETSVRRIVYGTRDGGRSAALKCNWPKRVREPSPSPSTTSTITGIRDLLFRVNGTEELYNEDSTSYHGPLFNFESTSNNVTQSPEPQEQAPIFTSAPITSLEFDEEYSKPMRQQFGYTVSAEHEDGVVTKMVGKYLQFSSRPPMTLQQFHHICEFPLSPAYEFYKKDTDGEVQEFEGNRSQHSHSY